jgi:small subunit ribosomal protein S20
MPVTKTAKRALRSQRGKEEVNNKIKTNLEIAVRAVKKSPTQENVRRAISLTDRAAKKKVIHKNKAARIKSSLSKLTKTSPAKSTKRGKTAKKK